MEVGEEPEHNQDIALISICFDIKPLNEKVIDIYKDDEDLELIDLVKV